MIIRHERNIVFVEMDKLINIYIDSMHYQQNIFEQEQDPLDHMKNADILVFDNLGNERFYNFVHYAKLLNIQQISLPTKQTNNFYFSNTS